ncbi:putative nuclease HARBI1 [Tanacetum coccineum]|uniref:Nuclease HARBI1 n=1 Tax=Tanacetum coccineum TaxID=301880 RepID=A0ABQ5FTW8_9ASTR
MARDLLSVQASTVASGSAFSLCGRVLSIRRTRFTLSSLEMCICLKKHIDTQERIQHTLILEDDCLEVEEQLLEVEAELGYTISISDEEIALDEQARKAAKLEKQMNAKLAWIHEKYNHRSETHIGGSSSQTHEIGDVYLTAEELHQLHLDEEALRETLEEQTMDEKAREEKIRQKQADDDEYFMEFGVMRIDSDYESSD